MSSNYREQLPLLKNLQGIDLKRHKVTEEIKVLPKAIADLEHDYLTAKENLESLKHELAEVEKAKRRDDSELALSVEHLRARETKLYAIKTNKEYQAAIKEIAEAKRQNREREDRILQAMEKIEELTKKTTQLEPEFADKEKSYGERAAEISAKQKELETTLAEIESQRSMLIGQIDKAIVQKYDIVRRRYADAITSVVRGVCGGCSMNVPPQLYNEILRSAELRTCPSCHRLIFADVAGGGEEVRT